MDADVQVSEQQQALGDYDALSSKKRLSTSRFS